jgi:hypothetical protein
MINLRAAGSACICQFFDCAWLGLGTFHHSASARRNVVNWLGRRLAHCETRVRFDWTQFDRKNPVRNASEWYRLALRLRLDTKNWRKST